MPANAEVPDLAPPPGALELTRQMEQQRLDYLSQRIEALRAENDLLKAKVERAERDQHDYVEYFTRELEMKDGVLADLKDEALKREQEYHNDLRVKCSAYEAQITSMRDKSVEVEGALRSRLKLVEEDLKMLGAFREAKTQIESKVAELTEELKEANLRREKELEELGRKFLIEKAMILKDMEKEKDHIIQDAKVEAENGLHAKTRAIWADNKRFGEEMKFQGQMVEEMQTEKARTEEENTRLRMDLEIYKEKELEYSKQIRQKTLALQAAQKRIRELEQAQVESHKRVMEDKTKLRNKLKKTMEESQVDVDGLRNLIKVKNKEMRQIRRLAQEIVDQRTEVEQFFLDSLEEVKGRIRQEREEKYQLELEEYNHKMRLASRDPNQGDFPKIRGRISQKNLCELSEEGNTKLPIKMLDKVDIRKLSWEDRERVLRMLFAKINAVTKGLREPMPTHPLDNPPLGRQGPVGRLRSNSGQVLLDDNVSIDGTSSLGSNS